MTTWVLLLLLVHEDKVPLYAREAGFKDQASCNTAGRDLCSASNAWKGDICRYTCHEDVPAEPKKKAAP